MGDSWKIDHRLCLKVMRLKRPTFANTIVVKSNSSGFFQKLFDEEMNKDLNYCMDLNNLSQSQILVLPESFGNIYLGETFSCYVSLHNDSRDTCKNVHLLCALQTGSQRISLFPSSETRSPIVDTLLSGCSVDHVLTHEVKELGSHVLVCEISYTCPNDSSSSVTLNDDKYNLKKYFKFQVHKPLDVKTKFYNAESNDIFLEAQVQNLTTEPLCLEKVLLDPSTYFEVDSFTSDLEHKSVFGPVNILRPQDSRQYCFCLRPKEESKETIRHFKGGLNIGKLDIVWRKNMGDKGRLQTSQLQKIAAPLGDISVIVNYLPNFVEVFSAFDLKVVITNHSERNMKLEMQLIESKNSPQMSWSGLISNSLGLLEPSGSTESTLQIIPNEVGLQTISGILITDTLLKRTYEFDDICNVFVVSDKEMMAALLQ